MCIVDLISFRDCGCEVYFPLFPCSSGFSADTKSCSDNSHVVRKVICSVDSYGTKGKLYCRECYLRTLQSIRENYASKYLDLIKEARSIDWTKSDIQGSLAEIEFEMNESIAEWREACGREYEADEPKLENLAQAIRFRFGPAPELADETSVDKRPFIFHAGREDIVSDRPSKNRAFNVARAWRERGVTATSK